MPGWSEMDLDAGAAFISSLLGEDELVYMVIPPGFKNHFGENKVKRLRRSMYGLCQSPLNYYKLVKEVYTQAGLKQCQADECVFVRFENDIKGGPKTLSNEDLLHQDAFMHMDTVPNRDLIAGRAESFKKISALGLLIPKSYQTSSMFVIHSIPKLELVYPFAPYRTRPRRQLTLVNNLPAAHFL